MARTHASGPPPLPGAPTSGGPDVAGSRGAPSAPTHIVRGIHDTDFDMDTDHDHPEQHQAHHAASATGDSGNAGAGSGEAGAVGQPSVPADGKVRSRKPFSSGQINHATAHMRAGTGHTKGNCRALEYSIQTQLRLADHGEATSTLFSGQCGVPDARTRTAG